MYWQLYFPRTFPKSAFVNIMDSWPLQTLGHYTSDIGKPISKYSDVKDTNHWNARSCPFQGTVSYCCHSGQTTVLFTERQNAHTYEKKSFSLQHPEISHFCAHTLVLCSASAAVMLVTNGYVSQYLCLLNTNKKIDFNSSNAVTGQIQRGCSSKV